MKKLMTLACSFVLVLSLNAQQTDLKTPGLKELWRTSGFAAPESVFYEPKENVLYVSNINGRPGDKDGNGYISKVSPDGKVINAKWVGDLNAPKGLAIVGGKLYVADITEIVEIDLATAKILNKYPAPSATFLNDLAADQKGNIYATNTFGGESIIFKLENGKVTQWLNSPTLNMPNGIYVQNDNLIVSAWGDKFNPANFTTEVPGKLLKVSVKSKKIVPIAENVGNLDGVAKLDKGRFIVTDWIGGKIIIVSRVQKKGPAQLTELLVTKQGTADIFLSADKKTLFVPQMMEGEVVAYGLE